MSFRKTAFMYVNRRAADVKIKGLKSYYYILNNMTRTAINPKDVATQTLMDMQGIFLPGCLLEVVHHSLLLGSYGWSCR